MFQLHWFSTSTAIQTKELATMLLWESFLSFFLPVFFPSFQINKIFNVLLEYSSFISLVVGFFARRVILKKCDLATDQLLVTIDEQFSNYQMKTALDNVAILKVESTHNRPHIQQNPARSRPTTYCSDICYCSKINVR